MGAPSTDAVRVIAHAPLRFEPAATGYVTRGLRFSSSLHAGHMDLRTRDQAMRVTFAGASSSAYLEPGETLRSVSNLIHGNDRTQWRTVPNYASVRARGVYPGVDALYYGNQGDLEYDLIVKPGADPRTIRLRITGVQPTIDAAGNLNAAFIQKRPVAYQLATDGSRQVVASRYRRNPDGTFGFQLGRYDRKRELVIDPTLTFSNYISGNSQDTAKAIGHDANGLIYVAGITLSNDPPFEVDPNSGLMPGGPQFPSSAGGYDCFLVVIDPKSTFGDPVIFATFLGGSDDDILNDMFVSPGGLVYLTGYTKSTNFPAGVTPGFLSSKTSGTTNAFVAVYDYTQDVSSQLRYSTYFGGGTGTTGNGITADANGRVWVAGTTNSSEVPPRGGLPTGLSGPSDAFVAGFNPTQSGDSSLIYSTFLGGSSFEQGYGIAAAPDGTLWVVGQTYSNDFPLSNNALQTNYNGASDAFVSQIDPAHGDTLKYSTYLGGSGLDVARRVRVDGNGRVIVTGFTTSGNFPGQGSGAIQPVYKGGSDAFVTVLNPAAASASQLVYSTYYGGSGAETANGLAVDANGVIYVAGYTGSYDLAVTDTSLFNCQGSNTRKLQGQDGFVLKLDPRVSGPSGMVYASCIATAGTQLAYGVDVDANGTIYVTGSTSGAIFDPLGGVAKPTSPPKIDGFVMGINPQ